MMSADWDENDAELLTQVHGRSGKNGQNSAISEIGL
jgi:hypothetical protein